MALLLHRAGNVSSSSQAYKLQHTDAETPQQLTASHAISPAALPEAEADSSGHDAAPSDAMVAAGIIVASAAHVPQVSSKCVAEAVSSLVVHWPVCLWLYHFCKICQSVYFYGGPSA